MIKHTTFAAIVATTVATLALAAAGVGVSGCGPTVPATPKWEADVYPLLVARCIRCHDNPLRGDPGTGRPAKGPFNFPTAATALPAFGILKSFGPQAVRGPVPNVTLSRMPPPPAEALADWEIQIIDNLAKESAPQ